LRLRSVNIVLVFEGNEALEPRIESICRAISKMADHLPDGKIESLPDKCIGRWHIEEKPDAV
jgi:hypothetical protein